MASLDTLSEFRWVVLWPCRSFATVSSTMIMISFAPLIGDIRGELGISAGTASLGFMGLHAVAAAIWWPAIGYPVQPHWNF